jgi:hypothetical protein
MRNEEPTIKEAVTLAQMARMCGLSRSRFYQLIHDGIFSEPSRHPVTGRPFYSRAQQEQCLEIRRSCCGLNGRVVLFYDHPAKPIGGSPSIKKTRPQPPRERQPPSCDQPRRDPLIEDLKHGLGQLGLSDIDDAAIKKALCDEYPDGGWKDMERVERGVVLRGVFRRLRAQNSRSSSATGVE